MAIASQVGQAVLACPTCGLAANSTTSGVLRLISTLRDGGCRHFEVDELPGLNHLFQHAKTGAVGEYGEIEETMAPEALEKIAGWILGR